MDLERAQRKGEGGRRGEEGGGEEEGVDGKLYDRGEERNGKGEREEGEKVLFCHFGETEDEHKGKGGWNRVCE